MRLYELRPMMSYLINTAPNTHAAPVDLYCTELVSSVGWLLVLYSHRYKYIGGCIFYSRAYRAWLSLEGVVSLSAGLTDIHVSG